MAEYDRQAVYQGAQVQPMNQDVGVMPRDVLAQDRQEGNELARRNLAETEQKMIDAHDFYNVTNDEEDIPATYRLAAAEIDRRMRLPDDDEDSLIDPATGQVSQAKLGELMKPVQDRLDIAGRGVVNPRYRMEVRKAAVKARNDLAVHMATEAVKVQDEKNQLAFQTAFDDAMEHDNYGEALRVVDRAEKLCHLPRMFVYQKRREVIRLCEGLCAVALRQKGSGRAGRGGGEVPAVFCGSGEGEDFEEADGGEGEEQRLEL